MLTEMIESEPGSIKKDKSQDSETTYNWYVVYTRHNCEKKLFDLLQKANYKCFLPLYTTVRQWSDRKKKVQVPLINSVVFVSVEEKELSRIYEFSQVKGVLKEFGKPAKVKENEIETLKILAKEWSGEAISTGNASQNIQKGDPVEVLRGPFKGISGELIELNGKHRVVVRINSMNVEFVINVPLNTIKKTETP
ncbi:MAG: UpxY family transcription antiterminator [Brumimicrobium sp.]|nr:UpxY family transcription antiterminator [Brumimicrobium sp.]